MQGKAFDVENKTFDVWHGGSYRVVPGLSDERMFHTGDDVFLQRRV